ncbi:MAG: TonB-dependent receptor [Rhizomicrobium sp.]
MSCIRCIRNPFHNLKPETAKGWEAGVDHTFFDGILRASATYFERHTHNQIDFVDTFTPPYGYYENLDRTRASGVETEIDAKLSDTLTVSADYTNLTAKNLLTGAELARRPHNSASGTLTWLPLPKLTLGTSVIFVGDRFDDGGNFTPLESNTTVNVFGSYAHHRQTGAVRPGREPVRRAQRRGVRLWPDGDRGLRRPARDPSRTASDMAQSGERYSRTAP